MFSIYLSINIFLLSIISSINLFVYMLIYLSLRLFICLSIYMVTCLDGDHYLVFFWGGGGQINLFSLCELPSYLYLLSLANLIPNISLYLSAFFGLSDTKYEYIHLSICFLWSIWYLVYLSIYLFSLVYLIINISIYLSAFFGLSDTKYISLSICFLWSIWY